MKDFIAFLKHPQESHRLGAKQIWKVILVYFAVLAAGLLIMAPFNILKISPESRLDDGLNTLPLWFSILLIPLFEELGFRAILRRNVFTLFISVAVLSWFAISMVMPGPMYSTDKLVLRIVIAVVVGVVVVLLFKDKIPGINYTVFFYVSAALFGFVHVHNVLDFKSVAIVLYSLCYFIRHTLSGVFYGYVRVGYGLWASYLFHLVNNLVPLLVLAIL